MGEDNAVKVKINIVAIRRRTFIELSFLAGKSTEA
jgi:hypothetical protein